MHEVYFVTKFRDKVDSLVTTSVLRTPAGANTLHLPHRRSSPAPGTSVSFKPPSPGRVHRGDDRAGRGVHLVDRARARAAAVRSAVQGRRQGAGDRRASSRTRRPTAATGTRWSPTGAGRRASRRTSGPRSRRSRTPARPTAASAITSRRSPRPTAACPSRCRHWSRIRTRPGGGSAPRAACWRPRCSTRRSPDTASSTPGSGGRSRSAGPPIDAIEKTHPYEVEAAITFLDAARDRDRAERPREQARRPGQGAEHRRHAARGLLARARSTTRTTSRAVPTAWRARGSPTTRSTTASTGSRHSSRTTAAGGSPGPCGCPRSSTSGAGS